MDDNINKLRITKCSSSNDRRDSDSEKLKTEINSNTIIYESVFDELPVSISLTDNLLNSVVSINFTELKESSSGSFGTVFEGYLESNKHIALKKVLQDNKYKNRELEIMRRLNHNNITTLLYYFYSKSAKNSNTFLNLVMEFVPQTISRILKFYYKSKAFMPMKYIKLYSYQMLRGINYIHQLGICHRDIKPQNVLINPTYGLLRICDFGSAKILVSSEKNISYICSRYYRAPELIFGATDYTLKIDIWSAGCVLAELLLNKPIFVGETSVDQLVEIIKVLGTPSTDDVIQMNKNYKSYNLPIVAPCSLNELFTNTEVANNVINLLKEMFEYNPNKRISAIKTLIHSFFDDLRRSDFKLDSKYTYPTLFDFSPAELQDTDEETKGYLIPKI